MKKQQLYIDPIERSLYDHLTDNQDPELITLQLLGETQKDVNETEEIDIEKIYHAVEDF